MVMVTKVGGLTPLASSPSGDGGFLSLDGGFLGPRPALVHDHIRCDHEQPADQLPIDQKKLLKSLGPCMLCTLLDHPCTYLLLTCTSLHI